MEKAIHPSRTLSKSQNWPPDHSGISHFDNEECFFRRLSFCWKHLISFVPAIWDLTGHIGQFWLKVKFSLWLEWTGPSVLTNGTSPFRQPGHVLVIWCKMNTPSPLPSSQDCEDRLRSRDIVPRKFQIWTTVQ